jgi:uncharacterized NAD(P)/FAD-binding protein YdhS
VTGGSTRKADLAIIGAGASGTHTLLALLKELASGDRMRTRPLSIVIVDRDPQFFSGVAYGRRSGRASLTLSTLKRFLPEEERVPFVDWLTSHEEELTASTDIDSAWLDRHGDDIVSRRWEHLFIPRRWYGAYLAERTHAAISQARSHGVADVSIVNAAVTSMNLSDNRHLVRAVDCDGKASEIDAAIVVLALGSPPARRLPVDDAPADGLIEDIFDPGLEQTLVRLRNRLTALPKQNRRVLVVGGNAAALEFVLAFRRGTADLEAPITVLSPTGRPRHWRRRRGDEVAELPDLAALRERAGAGEPVTAVELYEAAVSDLNAAVVSGTDIAAVSDIIDAIPYFLEILGLPDRAALAARYGMAITKLLREDCGDAVDVLDHCVQTRVIDFKVGRYRRSTYSNARFQVTATDGDGRDWILDQRFGAIVNATGFEKVSTARAPLIQQLLRDGIVEVSSSDAGLHVDSQFRAAPRLFVVGPLLAGNSNEGMLIWHAESVRRIISIAHEVAPCIARELGSLSSSALLTAHLPHDVEIRT